MHHSIHFTLTKFTLCYARKNRSTNLQRVSGDYFWISGYKWLQTLVIEELGFQKVHSGLNFDGDSCSDVKI